MHSSADDTLLRTNSVHLKKGPFGTHFGVSHYVAGPKGRERESGVISPGLAGRINAFSTSEKIVYCEKRKGNEHFSIVGDVCGTRTAGKGCILSKTEIARFPHEPHILFFVTPLITIFTTMKTVISSNTIEMTLQLICFGYVRH